MSRPWMPLYIGDYRGDTAHLSAAEHGAYLLLIMHYWQHGGLPNDDRSLARIAAGMSSDEWAAMKPRLEEFFDDGWKHSRIDAEIEKAQRLAENGRKGGMAKAKQASKQTPSKSPSKTPAESLAPPSLSFSLSSSDDSLNPEEVEEEKASGRWSFDEFWQLYPHKIGKPDARKSFDRIRKAKTVDFTELIAGLLRYAAKTDDRPWCNPATWLNQGRWEDQPADQPQRTLNETDRDRGKSDTKQALRELREFSQAPTSGSGSEPPLRLLPAAGFGK